MNFNLNPKQIIKGPIDVSGQLDSHYCSPVKEDSGWPIYQELHWWGFEPIFAGGDAGDLTEIKD